jgi:PilZ domain
MNQCNIAADNPKGWPRVSNPPERRSSPRCAAVKNQSRLEFAVPAGRRRTDARLVNISRDGALVVAENPPPDEAPVWLRVESPVRTDWVEAMIVRIGQDREIALQFPLGCPDDLLLASTVGIDLTSMILDRSSVASTFD